MESEIEFLSSGQILTGNTWTRRNLRWSVKRIKPDIGHLIRAIGESDGSQSAIVIDKRGIEVEILFSGDHDPVWVRRSDVEVIDEISKS